MNIASLITSLNPWILFPVVIGLGIGASELGVWLRKKTIAKEGKEGSIGSMIGPMLALLAFMLGFTFSITSSRFASRRELVVQQARSINTCYLRSGYIPEKQKQEIRGMLSQYTDLLVDLKNAADVDRTIPVLENLNIQIWNRAETLVHETMDSELRALYIESINEVVETYQKRKTVGLVYRIRGPIWTTLFLLFLLSMALAGYENSAHKRRRLLNIAFMATAFALIVTLIADMDSRSESRNFKANLQPLVDVQKMIHEKGVD